MNPEDASVVAKRLLCVLQGSEPTSNDALENFTFDVLQEMIGHDKELAMDLAEATAALIKAVANKPRNPINGLGPYFQFRVEDIAQQYYILHSSCVMCFYSQQQ